MLAIALFTGIAVAQNSYMTQPGSSSLFGNSKNTPEQEKATSQKTKRSSDEYGIYQGNNLLLFSAGFNIPSSSDDFDEIAKTGASYGIQVLHSFTDNIAFGVEFTANPFVGKVFPDGGSIDMQQYNVTASGRMYFDPQQKARLYVPLGLGLASTRLKGKGTYAGAKDSDSSLAVYLGLGLETELKINEAGNIILGVEGRFNHSQYDGDNLDYVSILIKSGFKF